MYASMPNFSVVIFAFEVVARRVFGGQAQVLGVRVVVQVRNQLVHRQRFCNAGVSVP